MKVALIVSTNERAGQLLPIFYEELVKNFEVVIFCPTSVRDYIYRNYPANSYCFCDFSLASNFSLATFLSELRTNTLLDQNLTKGIAGRWPQFIARGSLYTKVLFAVGRFLRKIKLVKSKTFWDKIEQFFLANRELGKKFKVGLYSLVVFPNPVLTDSELRVFYAAKKQGIKTITVDEALWHFSWKVYSFREVDKMFAWSKKSVEEAEKFHRILPENFEVVGPMRFDIYYRQDLFPSREEFCQHFDLESQDKLITFTLNRYPVNKAVVKIIHDAIKNGLLPKETKLLLRFIPKDTRDALPEQIEDLKKEFLEIDELGILRFDIPQDSDFCKKNIKDDNFLSLDVLHLGSILKYSNAALCINSTVLYEAHIFSTPAFYIGFEENGSGSFKTADYLHWETTEKALNYDRDLVTLTPKDLIRCLNFALNLDKNNPKWQKKCEKLIKTFMTYNDGKASQRIVQYLKNKVS